MTDNLPSVCVSEYCFRPELRSSRVVFDQGIGIMHHRSTSRFVALQYCLDAEG